MLSSERPIPGFYGHLLIPGYLEIFILSLQLTLLMRGQVLTMAKYGILQMVVLIGHIPFLLHPHPSLTEYTCLILAQGLLWVTLLMDIGDFI